MFKINKNNDSFEVIEIASENKLFVDRNYEKCREFVRKLKRGGFNGWTPEFFTKSALPSNNG
jgi:hypothetical protein